MIYLFLFILGAIIGSFINCFVYRARHGGSVWRGRSKCIHCQTGILGWDNVPLISYGMLGGRCRKCHKKIPGHYFLVELFTGLLFLLAGYLRFHDAAAQDWWYLSRDLFFVSILMIVFVYDLLYKIILPRVVWFGAVVGLAFNVAFLPVEPLDVIWAVLVGGGFFAAQYLVSRGRWIGGGDIRLGVMLGCWLLWPNIIVALFLAYIIGAIFSVGLLLKNKKYWRASLPFGVFLAVAAFITLYYGDYIVSWYLGLIYG